MTTLESKNAEQIVSRMEAVRRYGRFHAIELREDAKKVIDWREHVRSKPLIAASLASTAGFLLFRLATRRLTKAPNFGASSLRDPGTTSWKSKLFDTATQLAYDALKPQALNLMRAFFSEDARHDNIVENYQRRRQA